MAKIVSFATTVIVMTLCVKAWGEEVLPSVEETRAWFLEAVELTDQEHYAEALELFERLQGVRPHSTVLYNLAWCYSRVGRNDDAVEAFESFLRGADIDPERAAEAGAELARLRRIVGPPESAPSSASTLETPPTSDSALSDDSTSPPSNVEPTEETEERGRRRLRSPIFWALFGVTAATGVAMTAVGGITLSLSDRWLEEGNIADRDRGRSLTVVTNALLILLCVEAIATLVVGILTEFRGGQRAGRSPRRFANDRRTWAL